MNELIWFFPIIFIFHDMEEIIGFGIWYNKNRKMLDEKYPFVSRTHSNFSTEGMAVAVYEELIVCILICILARFVNSNYFLYLWLGSFIACAFHFVVHIIQSIVIKKYIPALITSILCLPVSIWIITVWIKYLNSSFFTIIFSAIIGLIIVGANLKFAQSLIGKFTLKVVNPSRD